MVGMMHGELDLAGRIALADAIGESPETIMSVHRLRRGLARAWALDGAAVVQGTLLPEEPHVHGEDAAAIQRLLAGVPGWECVNAPLAIAPGLAALLEQETGRPCQTGPEIYFVQERPLAVMADPEVRWLGPDDLPLLEAATGRLGMAGWRFGSAAALLADGIATGAVVAGDLVAVAFTSALGQAFAEVGVVTDEQFRGRGYASAAGALVCEDLHRAGIVPVWSTSEENAASRRVAARLGFREVSRRLYICR
jgi:GNAT superfamily N-acetyltransferase